MTADRVSKASQAQAAELQALGWGSINSISLPALIAKGYIYDAGGDINLGDAPRQGLQVVQNRQPV